MWSIFRRSLVGSYAKDITGDAWLNAISLPAAAQGAVRGKQPLRFSHELAGKIVVIHFWGSSSPISLQDLPYLHTLWEMYGEKGLVIIGVHTPEYSVTDDIANAENAALRFHLDYPIVHDPSYSTWDRYNTSTWPRTIVVDETGIIRVDHAGPHSKDVVEKGVRDLLRHISGEGAMVQPAALHSTPPISLSRQAIEAQGIALSPFVDPAQYHMPYKLPLHSIGLSGWWITSEKELVSGKSTSDQSLAIHFFGSSVACRMRALSPEGATIKVFLDTKEVTEKLLVTIEQEYVILEGAVLAAHMCKVVVITGSVGISSISFS